MKNELLCTLGPSSMNKQVIHRLDRLGASLFRINLSHTGLNEVAHAIDTIAALTNVPICLDTEGAQIRTGNFVSLGFDVSENSVVRAHRRRVPGNMKDINFSPVDIIDTFQIGDFISIDFNSVLVQIVDQTNDHVDMRVLNGGFIGRNKAVTVHRNINMPCLTEKDREAIEIGREMNGGIL